MLENIKEHIKKDSRMTRAHFAKFAYQVPPVAQIMGNFLYPTLTIHDYAALIAAQYFQMSFHYTACLPALLKIV